MNSLSCSIVIMYVLAFTAAAPVDEDSLGIVLADQLTGVDHDRDDGLDLLADNQSGANWMLRGGCLALKISATLNVFQNDKMSRSIPIPSSATVANTSSCSVLSSDVPSQVITLDWSEEGPSTDTHLVRNISFLFSVDTSSTTPVYGISKVTAMLEFSDSLAGSNNTRLGSHEVKGNFVRMTTGVMDPVKYVVPMNSSLFCDESLTLDMESRVLSSVDDEPQKSSLFIERIQFDAFRPERIPRGELQAASSCAMRNSPRDLLPILVGGGLAAVVLIIVSSYVFRKKTTKAKGYSTV